MNKVKPENTGWRDWRLSKRHREWGFGLNMTDIDWLVLEYKVDEPLAIIEYRTENSPDFDFDADSNIRAQRKLADRADLPFFVVRYAKNLSWFKVLPVNVKAVDIFNSRKDVDIKRLSELQFVDFLWSLRGRHIPYDVEEKIRNTGKPLQADLFS